MPHTAWFLLAIGLYGFSMPFLNRYANRIYERRLARLEVKVNLLMDKLGIEPEVPRNEVPGNRQPPVGS